MCFETPISALTNLRLRGGIQVLEQPTKKQTLVVIDDLLGKLDSGFPGIWMAYNTNLSQWLAHLFLTKLTDQKDTCVGCITASMAIEPLEWPTNGSEIGCSQDCPAQASSDRNPCKRVGSTF